jgi:hypothetical protein
LREKYGVNEFFYPNISMDVDLPYGLEGEVKDIINLLNKAGIKTTPENVFYTMRVKKKLLSIYKTTTNGTQVLEKFKEVISEHVKPVGVTIPTEIIFVSGVTAFLLYLATRFADSFMSEAGRILARKALARDRKKMAKEFNLTLTEYKFLERQIIILLDKKEGNILLSDLQKIVKTKMKKPSPKSKRRLKSRKKNI